MRSFYFTWHTGNDQSVQGSLRNKIRCMTLLMAAAVLLVSDIRVKGGERSAYDRACYGVLIGAQPQAVLAAQPYSIVVIDAEYYMAEEIEFLHERGQEVWAYINIGALENFRTYYEEFADDVLGPYEGWDEEYWMDVSETSWQQHIEELAMTCAGLGIDGLFLDNADVYNEYPTDEIYQGLKSILELTEPLTDTITLNGGDTFVERYLAEGGSAVDAVNQEGVFGTFDEDGNLIRQDAAVSVYYRTYLERCRENGLETYLVEYTEDEAVVAEIEAYCVETGSRCYISASKELTEN